MAVEGTAALADWRICCWFCLWLVWLRLRSERGEWDGDEEAEEFDDEWSLLVLLSLSSYRNKLWFQIYNLKMTQWIQFHELFKWTLRSIMCSSSVWGINWSSSLDLNSSLRISGGHRRPRTTLRLVERLVRSPPIQRSPRMSWEQGWANKSRWRQTKANLKHVWRDQFVSSQVNNCWAKSSSYKITF